MPAPRPPPPTCAICRSLVCMTWLYVCLPLSITSCVSASACRSDVISWRWALQVTGQEQCRKGQTIPPPTSLLLIATMTRTVLRIALCCC
jgi:hypothetical protein